MQPVMPCVTGNFLLRPVILPMPPKNTGSLNVMREKRPCCVLLFLYIFVDDLRGKEVGKKGKREKQLYHHA